MKFENKVIPEENYGMNVLNLYGIELASECVQPLPRLRNEPGPKNSPDDRGYSEFNRSEIGRALK